MPRRHLARPPGRAGGNRGFGFRNSFGFRLSSEFGFHDAKLMDFHDENCWSIACLNALLCDTSDRVKPLAHPDSFHLRAARGWLELGNPLEANEELEKIAPALGMHPDVLEVRWQISAKAKQWEACIDLAERIIALTPDNPFGWIHRSFALHELKRTQEAWDNLIRVIKKFPK